MKLLKLYVCTHSHQLLCTAYLSGLSLYVIQCTNTNTCESWGKTHQAIYRRLDSYKRAHHQTVTMQSALLRKHKTCTESRDSHISNRATHTLISMCASARLQIECCLLAVCGTAFTHFTLSQPHTSHASSRKQRGVGAPFSCLPPTPAVVLKHTSGTPVSAPPLHSTVQ